MDSGDPPEDQNLSDIDPLSNDDLDVALQKALEQIQLSPDDPILQLTCRYCNTAITPH